MHRTLLEAILKMTFCTGEENVKADEPKVAEPKSADAKAAETEVSY